ncbi:MAG: hypothetical protein GY928_36550 [Colwellia sp.]|nr:hypothetical protein [Colwellia sp.]
MKTYNTYAEAKAKNPDSGIVTTGPNWQKHGKDELIGKFEALRKDDGKCEWWHRLSDDGWIICNPKDYEEAPWNGEGLPPAGTECEISSCGNDWMDCVVKFVGTDLCVVNHGNWEQHYHLSSVKFRPLETPEQKKGREELEAAYGLYKTIVDGEPLAYNFEQFRSSPSIGGYLKAVRKYLLKD